MKQNVIKIAEHFERFSEKVVLILGIIIYFALSYYSMRYTEMFIEGTEVMETLVDSVLWNILALIGCLGAFGLLQFVVSRMPKEKQHRIAMVVRIISFVYVLVVGTIWITPSADAGVLRHVSALVYNGEYGTMIPPGYMSYCPHQYGLVFLLEILYAIFGEWNYVAFQYINVLLVVLAMYAAHKIIDMLFENDVISIYFALLSATCVPMLLYMAYVYGDAPSTSLCMVVMWNAIKYCKTGSKWAIPGMIVPALFAGMVRMNSLIVMIAVSIVLIFLAMKKWKPQVLLIIVAIFALILGASNGIPKIYGARSGNEVLGGIPLVSFIVMGLQDAPEGPGWHSGFDFEQYAEHGFDHDAAEATHKELLKVQLKDMWANKGKSLDFFRRKILTQWNAPDYNSYYSVENFTCEEQELPESIQNLFFGGLRDFLDGFMNRYQFVMYVSVLFFLIVSLWQKQPIENHLLLIAIIGGMFFSIMWEAMSRYILPYMFFSLPLMAAGIYKMQEKLVDFRNRLKRRK